MLVVVDCLKLRFGTVRLHEQPRGHGGHRGVESVMLSLGTREFPRLRIGIDGARNTSREHMADYVLTKIHSSDLDAFNESLHAASALIDEWVARVTAKT